MSDKTPKMVECVVVFDQIGIATGEYIEQGPGMHSLAVTTDAFRGDKVMLTEADAKRHLDSGAVILASDKRSKLVQPNEARHGGVRREVNVQSYVPVEEHTPLVAGDAGASRGKDGKLGTKAELERLGVTELKALAAKHGVTVERGDTKPKLAAKLAKVKVATADEVAEDGETTNPGQEPDESAPPEHQPDDAPAE